MPRERPTPPPFEPEALQRSLDRYLFWGLVFMVVLIMGFIAYRVREPDLRSAATRSQLASDRRVGQQLFGDNCASCHGKNAAGGSAPQLNAKEFLGSVSDSQMANIIAGGISGTDMPTWGLDFGGTLTDQQISQIVAWLRSQQPGAPSNPRWRLGAATPAPAPTSSP